MSKPLPDAHRSFVILFQRCLGECHVIFLHPCFRPRVLQDFVEMIKTLICTKHRPNKPKNGGITAGIPRAGRSRDAIGNGVDSSAEVSDRYSKSFMPYA